MLLSVTDDIIEREDLPALVQAGHLPGRQYAGAMEFFRNAPVWQRWALGALLALGVGHILAGIIFFFAFNWNDLSGFTKFAIVQGGLVLMTLIWLVLRLDSAVAQSFGIASTVLFGVLIAVFGQVYQTPSAPYMPFILWTIMTAPFAFVSRSVAHWAVWLLIALVAAVSYIHEAVKPEDAMLAEYMYLALAAVFLVLVGGHALVAKRAFIWAQAGWFQICLLLVALGLAFARFTGALFDEGPVLALIAAPLLTALAFVFLYLGRRSLAGMTLAVFFAAAMVAEIGLKLIFDRDNFSDDGFVGLIFLAAVWMILITGATGFIFRHLYRKFGTLQQRKQNSTAREQPDRTIADFANFLRIDAPAIAAALDPQRDHEAPWYMEFFLAISGIVTAIFVSLFFGTLLAITLDIENETVLMALGLVVYGSGIFMRRRYASTFTRHLFNTLLLGGGALALVGFAIMADNATAISIVGMGMAAITIFLIRDRIIEFLMALAIAGFLL